LAGFVVVEESSQTAQSDHDHASQAQCCSYVNADSFLSVV
jgi:hypothetical protein